MADNDETSARRPTERLEDHLAELDDRPEEMQQRLDELGEGIEAARRQAEADDLLAPEEGGAVADEAEWPGGDDERQTPVSDADHPPGG